MSALHKPPLQPPVLRDMVELDQVHTVARSLAAASLQVTEPRPPASNAGGQAFGLREACEADAAAIAAIYNASLRRAPCQPAEANPIQAARWLALELQKVNDLAVPPTSNYLGPMSVKMTQTWMAMHRLAGRRLWVATRGDEPVGWLSFLGFSDRPGAAGTHEVSFYIAPAWQRQGVGRALLTRALFEAPQWQADRLIAHVWDDNQPSLTLLRRMGFGIWGRLPGVIQAYGKRRDMLIAGIALAAQCAAA